MSYEDDAEDRERFFWVVFIAIIILLAAGRQINRSNNEPPVNNEPYTGLCNRPTPQGGC